MWKIYFWFGILWVFTFALGIVVARLLWLTKYDAVMQISTKNPEIDKYQLVILCPLDDLNKKQHLLVKVQKDI